MCLFRVTYVLSSNATFYGIVLNLNLILKIWWFVEVVILRFEIYYWSEMGFFMWRLRWYLWFIFSHFHTLTDARRKAVERHSQQVIISRHTVVPTQENAHIHVLTRTVSEHFQLRIAWSHTPSFMNLLTILKM